MTICNIYGFGYLNERKHSWLEFFNKIRADKAEWPYDRMKSVLSDLTEYEHDFTWRDLLFPTSYISSMDVRQLGDLTDKHPLIVDCLLSGAPEDDIPCRNITHFTWDPMYQGCHTIRVPEFVTKVRRSIYNYQQSQNKSITNSFMKILTLNASPFVNKQVR